LRIPELVYYEISLPLALAGFYLPFLKHFNVPYLRCFWEDAITSSQM